MIPRTTAVAAAALACLVLAACSGAPADVPAENVAASPESVPVELDPIQADTTPPVVPLSDPWATTSLAPGGEQREPLREPDVIYHPTPDEVVAQMLDIADVGPGDVLYDLGAGDGRINITAAREHGTRGVGIEIDPLLVDYARHVAAEAGVGHLVNFVEDDMFEADLSQATVVTLYLLPDLNLRLRPKLLSLAPGTRVVSHNYHMDDWRPDESRQVGESVVYLWRVPEEIPAHLRE